MPSRPLILLALALVSCAKEPVEKRLLRDFEGAYPLEARPTGAVREFELTAAEAELPLVDGHRMKVWAYNGQVPGPTFRIKLGETLRVRFTNRLPQPTTVHWHGVRVPNGMDGVPHATQPPVEPGGSFTYEFTPKDAGTFWFHPHLRSSEQVERGLYGVLIVEDQKPLPYSQDVAWVLDDWMLDEQGQIIERFNTRHDLMHDGRWGNAITVNARTDTALRLRPGERVRLRLVNSANGRIFLPDFGDLEARVIAADGLYLRHPVPAQGFEVAPGNRLDVELSAPASGTFPVVDRFYAKTPNHLADVVVQGEAVQAPAFEPPRGKVPAWAEALSTPVTKEFKLSSQAGGEYGIQWMFNGEAFAGHDHHGPPALTMQQGRFQHLRFTNESYRLHPIHLHGMFFKLLARNGQPMDEPFFRDTVLVHSKETVDVGLVPEDVGRWMMHCHILEHAEAGMMTFLQVSE